jgi:hypothetical protein
MVFVAAAGAALDRQDRADPCIKKNPETPSALLASGCTRENL